MPAVFCFHKAVMGFPHFLLYDNYIPKSRFFRLTQTLQARRTHWTWHGTAQDWDMSINLNKCVYLAFGHSDPFNFDGVKIISAHSQAWRRHWMWHGTGQRIGICPSIQTRVCTVEFLSIVSKPHDFSALGSFKSDNVTSSLNRRNAVSEARDVLLLIKSVTSCISTFVLHSCSYAFGVLYPDMFTILSGKMYCTVCMSKIWQRDHQRVQNACPMKRANAVLDFFLWRKRTGEIR